MSFEASLGIEKLQLHPVSLEKLPENWFKLEAATKQAANKHCQVHNNQRSLPHFALPK